MSTGFKITIGAGMLLLGACLMLGCKWIVFPGLELLLGIETIVGRENVHYFGDGTYAFTDPGAMIRWIAGVFGVGLVVSVSGCALAFCARGRRAQ